MYDDRYKMNDFGLGIRANDSIQRSAMMDPFARIQHQIVNPIQYNSMMNGTLPGMNLSTARDMRAIRGPMPGMANFWMIGTH